MTGLLGQAGFISHFFLTYVFMLILHPCFVPFPSSIYPHVHFIYTYNTTISPDSYCMTRTTLIYISDTITTHVRLFSFSNENAGSAHLRMRKHPLIQSKNSQQQQIIAWRTHQNNHGPGATWILKKRRRELAEEIFIYTPYIWI